MERWLLIYANRSVIVDTKKESEQFSSASVLVGMTDLCRLFFVDG